MVVGQLCGHASAGRALDESLHDKEGLVNILHRSGVLADGGCDGADAYRTASEDRKSTRLNSSHANISYAVFCLKKKTQDNGNHSNYSRKTRYNIDNDNS